MTLLGLTLFVLLSVSVRAAETGTPQVMILGVAHLEAKHDVHNSVFADSPLSNKRQAQIADIIFRLARFAPTKVLVEEPMGNVAFPDRYRRYLAGRFALPGDEAYQFGFKLAARAANHTIYPIDTFGPTLLNDDRRIDVFLQAHFTSVSDAPFDAFVAQANALERTGTYLDLLRYLNTDAAIRANASWYSVFDGIGRESHDAGSSYVSQWYARNCYIFSNILSVIRPGDRVVVIMGQGHEYLLREFVRLNPHLVDVNPLTYLMLPTPPRTPAASFAGHRPAFHPA